MTLFIVTKAPSGPVITYGFDKSTETALPLPPGEYPDAETIPVFGLPGIMFKSEYDTNNDGVVDHAHLADFATNVGGVQIHWSDIVDPPARFPSTIPLVDDLQHQLDILAAADGGGGLTAFVYTQSTPATVWVINHNLGYKPLVEVFDSTDTLFDANVMHASVNQTIITLNVAASGWARLV